MPQFLLWFLFEINLRVFSKRLTLMPQFVSSLFYLKIICENLSNVQKIPQLLPWLLFIFVRGRLGGFDPPPSDQVQQEIDDLKQNIIDLQNQLAQINKSGQIDDVDGKIATLQDAIAQLTVKMDTLVKDGEIFICKL